MKKDNIDTKPEDSINQLNLYGYEDYFNSFVKLHKKNKLPKIILLSGPKGIGKATFAYHFINYLLSKNEDNEYSMNDFKINPNNKSYKLIKASTHPNFFLLQNELFDENIKIDQVRNLIKFLSMSTHYKNIKCILIDNSEYLNINSSNALLKSLEEPGDNTYFFIINNNSTKLLSTVKSRCTEFKISFNLEDKKNIFRKIIQQYQLDLETINLFESFYFDSPGNLLKYLIFFKDTKLNILDDKLSCIFYLLEKYKLKKDTELISTASLFIELFYNELSIKNKNNLNYYFLNRQKIVNEINDMKKFNLNKSNLLFSVKEILTNESR